MWTVKMKEEVWKIKLKILDELWVSCMAAASFAIPDDFIKKLFQSLPSIVWMQSSKLMGAIQDINFISEGITNLCSDVFAACLVIKSK